MLGDHVKVFRQRTIGDKNRLPPARKQRATAHEGDLLVRTGQNLSPDQGSTKGFVTCLTNAGLTTCGVVVLVESGQALVRVLGRCAPSVSFPWTSGTAAKRARRQTTQIPTRCCLPWPGFVDSGMGKESSKAPVRATPCWC